MHSMRRLSELRDLPAVRRQTRTSTDDLWAELVAGDRTLKAAEAAATASFALWGILPGVNVDDHLFEAYGMAYPGLAADQSLYEHFLTVAESGDASITGLVSGLKGKLAEFHAKDLLQQNGYTSVEIAQSPTQAVWDISAVDPAGDLVTFQVKTGAESYADEFVSALEAEPDVHFMVSSEIYNEIAADSPDYIEQLTDIGNDYRLVESIDDGLGVLSGNMGVDIPDIVLEVIPYVAEITAAVSLIYGAVRTEQEFNDTDRSVTNKMHIVRTLTLMSRFGIRTVLMTVGGLGGTVAGTALPVPGAGNLIGGIAGTVGGAVAGWYLNKHLQPYMLDLALNITDLTLDDLFYYKNRTHIDEVAVRFRETAHWLTAPN